MPCQRGSVRHSSSSWAASWRIRSSREGRSACDGADEPADSPARGLPLWMLTGPSSFLRGVLIVFLPCTVGAVQGAMGRRRTVALAHRRGPGRRWTAGSGAGRVPSPSRPVRASDRRSQGQGAASPPGADPSRRPPTGVRPPAAPTATRPPPDAGRPRWGCGGLDERAALGGFRRRSGRMMRLPPA